MADNELAKLVVRIQTIGEKEAKAALDAIDQSGKQAATGGLTQAEHASSRLSESVLGTTGEMKKLGRELTASAGEALGFGKASGALGAELGELGIAGVGTAAAIAGLVLIHKELNRVEEETKNKAEATASALLKQKQAADAATVAGARLALQQAQSVDAGTGKPGFFSTLKVGALTAIGGFGIGAKEAAEESIIAAQKLADKTDAVTQAKNNLATALKNEADGTLKADAVNINALATLVKLGVATGEERRQALLMLAGLTTSLNALPVSDTVGRAGLAGQIKELNDALFPKLHEHVKKLGKELSALATAPHIGITPAKGGAEAAVQSGGVVATDTIFGPLKTLKENPATTQAVEGIHQQTEAVAEAIKEQARQIQDAAMSASQVIGNALEEGFAAAFDGGGIVGGIKAFGKTLLAGIGGVFEQQGEAMIAYGLMMTGLVPLIANPFTSGPALIAWGAAITALGAAMGAIAHSGGHSSTQRAPSAGSATIEATRLKFVNRDGSEVSPRPSITNNNTFIGVNDPSAQRALKQMLVNGDRR